LNRQNRRLVPVAKKPLGPVARLVTEFALGDPSDPTDSFKPRLRRDRLHSLVRAIAANQGRSPV